MSFILRDNQVGAYDELWDQVVATLVSKGDAAIVQDVFGFYMTAALAIGDEIAYIYIARQVLAGKTQGSGEAINAGDRVYYMVATGLITANPVGTIGTEYYYCGTAKKDALAVDSTVLIRFDGTMPSNADMD